MNYIHNILRFVTAYFSVHVAVMATRHRIGKQSSGKPELFGNSVSSS